MIHFFQRALVTVAVAGPFIAATGCALAQSSAPQVKAPQNTSAGLTGAGVKLAMHGYDPVAYFEAGLPTPGSAEHTAVHGRAAYRFASKKNQAAFERDPAAFLPQFGGYCAYGVSVGKKFDGDPRVFEIVDGKLYLNLNPDIQATWRKDQRGNIRKAEQQWANVRPTPGHAVLQDDSVNVGSGLTAAGAPLALHGYDPVAYFRAKLPTLGSARFTATHGDAAYRFVSADNQAAFEQNPEAYLPQFGGFCAYGVSVGKKFDGDPRVFEIVDGKLYLNLNPTIQAAWRKDVPGNIRKADAQWRTIRAKAAGEL